MTTDRTRQFSSGADGREHVMGELVVDSDHATLVLGLLPEGMGQISEEIPALGLTLLTLDAVDAAIDRLQPPTRLFTPPAGADDLERLMAALRSASAGAYDGWVPTIGKNRVVMGPEAYPYFSPKEDPDDGPTPGPQPLGAQAGVSRGDGSGIVVGVLDTRVIRHPAYVDVVRFLADSETTSDQVADAWQGHGTFVTGLVHAYAPDAMILVRSVLTGNGGTATAWEAGQGLVNLVQAGASVINMSLGCVTGDNRPPFAIRAAVERLRDRAVLVAAAGNYDRRKDGGEPPSWPAALDGVLAVGSEASEGVRSGFSPEKPWVDLVADGERVSSTFATRQEVRCPLRVGGPAFRDFYGTATWSGTSFAAAIVTARVAALASVSGYPFTGRSPQALAKQLRDDRYPEDRIARRPKRHY